MERQNDFLLRVNRYQARIAELQTSLTKKDQTLGRLRAEVRRLYERLGTIVAEQGTSADERMFQELDLSVLKAEEEEKERLRSPLSLIDLVKKRGKRNQSDESWGVFEEDSFGPTKPQRGKQVPSARSPGRGEAAANPARRANSARSTTRTASTRSTQRPRQSSPRRPIDTPPRQQPSSERKRRSILKQESRYVISSSRGEDILPTESAEPLPRASPVRRRITFEDQIVPETRVDEPRRPPPFDVDELLSRNEFVLGSILSYLRVRDILQLRRLNLFWSGRVTNFLTKTHITTLLEAALRCRELVLRYEELSQPRRLGDGKRPRSANTRGRPGEMELVFRTGQLKNEGPLTTVELSRVEILTFKNLLKRAKPPEFLLIIVSALTHLLHDEKDTAEITAKLTNPLYCLHYFDLNFSIVDVRLNDEKYSKITTMFTKFTFDKQMYSGLHFAVKSLLKWMDACLLHYELKRNKVRDLQTYKVLAVQESERLQFLQSEIEIAKKMIRRFDPNSV
eukprot:TRINITY_DN7360_c0_g1_i4.p1 TRINITY_DN7360_c0_g1~~TRINITY_DN7360_c0_g1_i4.p1  ORF type:complete len:510 (-),score=110.02 TRINITY_DN7360_c0_g1_i4:67-1596(-)